MPASDNRSVARITAIVIAMVLATGLALLLLYQMRQVLVWIVVAALFATALHPLADWVERHVTWCRRWLSTLVVFLAVFVLLGGLVALFVTPLVHEGARFADEAPQLIADARAGRGPVGDVLRRFHVLQWMQQHREQIQQYVRSLGGGTLAFARSAASTVAGIVTIFVLSYLMVLEAPKVLATFLALFAPERAERVRRVGRDCAKTITGYISGNLLISVICGLLTYVVLLLTGVPFAGLIAVFVAVADLVPLVGATLGAVVAAVAGFVHSTTAGIIVIVFFVVYQQLENHLLQPVILSRTVKLNPLTVLIAILAGVDLAGILGALLAIPVAGMIQIIVRDVWDTHRGGLKPAATVGEDRTPASPS
ncbi:AI-2E family transporter [Dactylosporangium sp. NPDC049140]|uniref:AI-2E family transporter n=1 Tax=Dactylosporangium sp. NPDC049140 TaxID=3155647 RepID=UPI00340B0DC5